jgi:hypothetical protein
MQLADHPIEWQGEVVGHLEDPEGTIEGWGRSKFGGRWKPLPGASTQSFLWQVEQHGQLETTTAADREFGRKRFFTFGCDGWAWEYTLLVDRAKLFAMFRTLRPHDD